MNVVVDMLLAIIDFVTDGVKVESPIFGVPFGGYVNLLEQGVDTLGLVTRIVAYPVVEKVAERCEALVSAPAILRILGICQVRLEMRTRIIQVGIKDVACMHLLTGVAVGHRLLIDAEVVPMHLRIVEVVNLKAVDEGIDLLLVTCLDAAVQTTFDDGIHPAIIGVGDGARKGLDEILISG